MTQTSRSDLRQKWLPYYELLYKAYPVHQDFGGGFTALLDLIEAGGFDADYVLKKAQAFAQNTDPNDLRYVPHLKSWLRDRRFEDIDLFTDQVAAQREWLLGVYKRADVRAITNKYGFIYTHPPVPETVQDLDAWHEDQRRVWIGKIGRFLLHGEEYPQ